MALISMPATALGSSKILFISALSIPKFANHSESVLMTAVKGNSSALVECLLQEGADYQHLTHGRSSILHMAASEGTADCLRVLRSHKLRGLRIDIVNARGETALDHAEMRTDVGEEWLTAWRELITTMMEADKDTERDMPVEVHDMNDDTMDEEEKEIFMDALEVVGVSKEDETKKLS